MQNFIEKTSKKFSLLLGEQRKTVHRSEAIDQTGKIQTKRQKDGQHAQMNKMLTDYRITKREEQTEILNGRENTREKLKESMINVILLNEEWR